MNETYSITEPARADVDTLAGSTVIEFGTPWCGHCRAAQPLIASALAEHPGVHHIKVEDGSGKRLGRTFGVKLWPTLVFLRNGKEIARLVRPREVALISRALAQLESAR